MWIRVLFLVAALALAGIGQFVLIQENDRMQQVATSLEGVTTEEIDRSRLIFIQTRELAHRSDASATDELAADLWREASQLETLHERRVGLAGQLPGPPAPTQVQDRVGSLVALTQEIQAAEDPADRAQQALEQVDRTQGELVTLLAADQDARQQAVRAEVAQNEGWSFTILGGILALLLLAGTHVVRPSLAHIREREATFDADVRALEREMAAQQAAAEERERELEATIEDLEQFAYVASHDLQEPLRMVGSYVQLLERQLGDDLDEDSEVYMGYIREGVGRMKQLIDDLLAYSRVGTAGTALQPTELQAALDDALTNLEVRIDETDAEITQDRVPAVLGDRSQLTQLFQNLISNALKFQPREQQPRVHIGAERAEDGAWTISVADNGIGIDEDQRERIFVIFQRSQARDAYPGTGIGLAICKKIVERHEGEIWVDSQGQRQPEPSSNGKTVPAEPGDGATFKFTLQPAPTPSTEGTEGAPGDEDRSVHDRSRELI